MQVMCRWPLCLSTVLIILGYVGFYFFSFLFFSFGLVFVLLLESIPFSHMSLNSAYEPSAPMYQVEKVHLGFFFFLH